MASGLIEASFVRSACRVPASRWHAQLVCVLRGSARLGDTRLSAEDGALAVANGGEAVDLRLARGSVALLCRIDLRQLRRLTNDRQLVFVCNPSLRHQERYAELRACVDVLVRALAQHDDFARLGREEAELVLVRCLLDGFIAPPASAPTRGELFCAYLDAHYEEPLAQADVAASFGLSPEHFSRAFKQETGETFHAYLTQLRLEAAEQLLVETTHTVSRVALDAGFPNIASFNQAFKRAHGVTPSAWRAERQADAGQSQPPDAVVASLDPALADVAERRRQTAFDLRFHAHDRADVSLPWGKVFAVGSPATLVSARAREQVRWLHERLGFHYARLTCDLEALTADEGRRALEDALDFLLDLHVKVLLALELGPDADAGACMDAFERVLRGCSNRYSVANVRSWRFELRPHRGLAADDPAYVSLFAQAHGLLLRFGVQRGLAGPGVLLTAQAQNLRAFLRALRARDIEPGAVTIAARPAVPTGPSASDYVRTADRLFLRNQVLLASEALAEEGFGSTPLQVGGWCDSLETRNLMNDACAEGAALCQALLSCAGLVDSVCYDWPSDLTLSRAGSRDDYRLLSGKPGLLTRDGIPKPSFHALAFLSQVGGQVVHVSQRCAASTNDMGNYQVVCHNCERLGARYLATDESALSYEEMPSYFDDPRPRVARVRIEGARIGTYLVKKRIVNAQGGSVVDAAARMRLWCMDDPGRSEIEYLRSCAQPQVELETVLCTQGTIAFEHELASNEIAYFHVIFLY